MLGLACVAITLTNIGPDDWLNVAPPGTKVATSFLKPGYVAKIETRKGVFVDPAEANWFLALTKPGGKQVKIKDLSDFKGAVHIRNTGDALKFCRIWTDVHLFRYFNPRALEVRFSPASRRNGSAALIWQKRWKQLIESKVTANKTSKGFVITRLVATSVHSEYDACYLARETVTEDGQYSRALTKFKAGNDFDKIYWHLPNWE